MTTLDDLARVERELRRDAEIVREYSKGTPGTPGLLVEHADTIAAYVKAQSVRDATSRERGAANGWQPMDSAPKGLPILTLMKHGAIEGEWDGETAGGYYWRDMDWYPTHWMPLPSPPNPKAKGFKEPTP